MEPETCISALATWIKNKKIEISDDITVNSRNTPADLQEYCTRIEDLAHELCKAIRYENTEVLHRLQFPDDLIQCSKSLDVRTVMIDKIEDWCIREENVYRRVQN